MQHQLVYQQHVFDRLRGFVEDDVLVDVTLRVGQKRYSCHKIMLCASSVYFEKMFLSGFKESDSSDVELMGISSLGFDEIHNHIYSGDIKLTETNFIDVYDAADMLLFAEVKEKVITYIYGTLSHKTCLKYGLFADERDITDLMRRCKDVLLENFEDICSQVEDVAMDLPYDMILDTIKEDSLVFRDEVSLLNQLNRWMQNHPQLSEMEKDRLLRKIRWGLLHLKDFQDIEGASGLESHWKSIVDIHTKASCGEKILLELIYGKCFQMRGSQTMVKVVGTRTEENKTNWTFHREIDQDVQENMVLNAAAVQVGNHIVVMGGSNESLERGETQPTTDAFDMKANRWESLAPMNEPRYHHVAVAFDTYILVIGGNGKITDSVERYDIAKNEWKRMNPFVRCVHMLGCSYENDIYICGGYVYDEDDDMYFQNNCLYKYNHKEDTWTKLCTIPDYGLPVDGVCVHKEKIYMRRFGRRGFFTFDPVDLVLDEEMFDDQIDVLFPDDLLLPCVLAENVNDKHKCNTWFEQLFQ